MFSSSVAKAASTAAEDDDSPRLMDAKKLRRVASARTPTGSSLRRSSSTGRYNNGSAHGSIPAEAMHHSSLAPVERTTSVRSVSLRKIKATEWNDAEQERRYDLTPVEQRKNGKSGQMRRSQTTPVASRGAFQFVDPWEVAEAERRADGEEIMGIVPPSPGGNNSDISGISSGTEGAETTEGETGLDGERGGEQGGSKVSGDSNVEVGEEESLIDGKKSVFIVPGDIHPNMENRAADIEQLRLLAGKLSADWRVDTGAMAVPALARRIRDFQFAQEKRRKKYGDERPWGILGLYDHLSSIRTDVEWAEDAANRRANGEPYLSWADFDESKKSGYNRPFFTYILLFICTVLLITSIALNGWKVEPLNENPMIGPSADTLVKMGAKVTEKIVNENQGWRLLSSTVLHAGLVHYFINMLALWFVGGAIETSHGSIAALIIFIISAVGGTVMSAIFLPEYITVGASGGIFGFIGACLADIIMNWKLLFCDFVTENGKKQSHIVVVLILVVDIALNCVIGLTPFVDNFTHLGGMIYGFLCGISTMERLSTDFFGMEESWTSRAKHFFMRFFGIILSVVALVITLVVLMQGDGATTPCPNCTWLSCVTFPPWEDNNNKWWYCDDCGLVSADIVQQPSLHLELDCPKGDIVTVDLTEEDDVSKDVLQKKLPYFCRQYCPHTERN